MKSKWNFHDFDEEFLKIIKYVVADIEKMKKLWYNLICEKV